MALQPFKSLTGVAAPLPTANIDTDVVMPKVFLKGTTRDGLARGLFHDLRFGRGGEPVENFVLNRPGYHEARFLVVGPNFGCGSSREHAVWGLQEWGIRAVIGSSFASIFNDNCYSNGLLPVWLGAAEIDQLTALVERLDTATITVDLPTQTVTAAAGWRVRFEIDAIRKDRLIRGLDAIGATLEIADDIRAFEATRLAEQPWLDFADPHPQAEGGARG